MRIRFDMSPVTLHTPKTQAHWAASVQEECTLLNQRLDALEAELGSDAKAALRYV